MTPPKRTFSVVFKVISVIQSVFLTVFFVIPPNLVQAQSFNVLNLPEPGSLVNVSESFVPVLLKGISLHPENPLVFDFIVDPGNTGFGDNQIREEGQRLIKYFLAALTVPEKDLWVNLSPFEKDRIIPTAFGQTEMGRDLLAQDYILKQISASMIYPENDLGKDFWGRVYAKAKEVYGTVKIPVSTFNRVWIVPDKAVIVENEQTAFVASGHLKVMLEEDYAAINQNRADEILGNNPLKEQNLKKLNSISSAVVRDIILPEIEKEVNEGKNFAQLRQIYYSLVLAAWFKNNLKDNILTQVYADQQKISGVNIDDINDKQKIYDRYMEAYREGVFNYIKEDIDATTQEMIPRKYFSGGADYTKVRESIVTKPVSGIGEIQMLQNQGDIPQNALNTVKPDESFRVLTAGLNRFNDAAAANDKPSRPVFDKDTVAAGNERFQLASGDYAMLSSDELDPEVFWALDTGLRTPDIMPVVQRQAPQMVETGLKSEDLGVQLAAAQVALNPNAKVTPETKQQAIRVVEQGLKRGAPQERGQAEAIVLERPNEFGEREVSEARVAVSARIAQTQQPTLPTRVTFEALEIGLRSPDIMPVVQRQAPQMVETGLKSEDPGVQLAAAQVALNPNAKVTPETKQQAIRVVEQGLKRGTPQERGQAEAIVLERPNEFGEREVSEARVAVSARISEIAQKVSISNAKQLSRVGMAMFNDRPVPVVVSRTDDKSKLNFERVAMVARGFTASLTSKESSEIEKLQIAPEESGLEVVALVIEDQTLVMPWESIEHPERFPEKPEIKTRAELGKISKPLGGIDFNPTLMNMEINKENGGIKVRFDPKILQEIRDQGVEGFIPVILNVQPLKTALPLLTKGSVQEPVVQLTKL